VTFLVASRVPVCCDDGGAFGLVDSGDGPEMPVCCC
jgi:hypothetical protein